VRCLVAAILRCGAANLTAVILGCGYTGARVAHRLARRGVRLIATTRHPERLAGLAAEVVPALPEVPPGAVVLYSIPAFIPKLCVHAARVVYLSTTGVYGETVDVDELTAVSPHERLESEHAVLTGPWSGLVLRPAAIYGPGRGVHVRVARGDYPLVGDGSNYVSRIHVDDLAAICEAALFSSITGAYPVADDDPCSSREIVEFCARLLRVPMPPSVSAEDVHRTRRANRRVDGRAIRRILGVELKYPSYRVGIPASLGPADASLA
jgi:nucleoside-diphosphate-sugar epimerase